MFPLHTKPKIIFFFTFRNTSKTKDSLFTQLYSWHICPISGLHFLFLAGLPENIPLANSSNMGQFGFEVDRWHFMDFCPLLFRLNRSHFIILLFYQFLRTGITFFAAIFDLDGGFKIIIKVLMYALVFSFRSFFCFPIILSIYIFLRTFSQKSSLWPSLYYWCSTFLFLVIYCMHQVFGLL